MEQLMRLMRVEAKGYNKYLTQEYLDKLPIEQLIHFTNPCSREYYDKQIRQINRENKNKEE